MRSASCFGKVADEIEATGVVFPHRIGGTTAGRNNIFPLSCTPTRSSRRGPLTPKARAAANNIRATAQLVINRRQREAMRQVLLSGISLRLLLIS